MPTAAYAEPLHAQVRELLAQRIASGQLAGGARLPSERDLCHELGVSRVTLRKALLMLAEEGQLVAAKGRGWFVATEPVSEPPNALMSFSAMAALRGLQATSDVLVQQTRASSFEEAEALGIAPGAEVFELRRVRRLDDLAVALEEVRLPASAVGSTAAVDFARDSLHGLLAARGNVPSRSDCTVSAVLATEEQADLLETSPGAALLVVRQTSFDQHDRPLELNVSYLRGDRYRFTAALRAPGADLA
jgi:DNA-binding GntR family transcriptional regulator